MRELANDNAQRRDGWRSIGDLVSKIVKRIAEQPRKRDA